jgi:hypothetical protein
MGERERLEALRKDASDPTLCAGDWIFFQGYYTQVRLIKEHKPGAHPRSTVHNHLTAEELVTDYGSRWRAKR